MPDRTFGGFRYDQRLQVGFFGEVYRGRSKQGGTEIRVTRIADGLAKLKAFSESLMHFGRAYALLKHDNIVATRAVGRDTNDDLLVVTDRIPKPVTLEEVLIDFDGEPVPRQVALAICSAVIDGLAYLHSVGLCHGALHPRSIWIDQHGGIFLADCAPARALAAAGATHPKLLDGVRDYVAPETRKGHDIGAGADVYAAGLLVRELLEDEGEFAPVIRKAAADDPHERFADGGSLKRAFDLTIRSESVDLAERETLALLGRASGSSEPEALDAATEDLLAELGIPGTGSAKVVAPRPPTGLDDALGALDDEDDVDVAPTEESPTRTPPPEPLPAPPSDPTGSSGRRFPRAKPREQPQPPPAQEPSEIRRARDAVRARGKVDGSSVEPETGEVTQVDDVEALLAQTDPISEIIKLGPAGAPAGDSAEEAAAVDAIDALSAELDADEPANLDGPSTTVGSRRAAQDKADRPPPKPSTAESKALAASAIDALAAEFGDDDEDDDGGDDALADPIPPLGPTASKPAQAALSEPRALPALDQPYLVPDDMQLKKSRGIWWMAAAVIAVGSAFGYVYTQTDVFHPERAQAKADKAERDRLAKERALKDAQDKPGAITVKSTEADAAVWLLLGRTPLDTFRLPASATNDLRFEHDGYKPLDLAVVGQNWTEGEDKKLTAGIHARLEPGRLETPLPAFPAEPDKPPPPGPDGQGVVHVESTPSGSQVWLLVGFTPEVTVAGLVAGKTYEVKVRKEGFIPGYAVFKDSTWYLSGETGVGKVKPTLGQEVKLEPSPDQKPKKPKKPKK